MTTLPEAFQAKDSRVYRTFAVVCLVGATSIKQRNAESAWLPTYGWFFELLNETMELFGGDIVKYVDGGVLAVFDDEATTDAMNWAIRVQEEMSKAQQARRVLCDCSIGISFGEAVRFTTKKGHADYIGEIVDRAFLLSRAANGKALFVDTNSIREASMRKVQSQLGAYLSRTSDEYLGSVESVVDDGFQDAVDYHEFWWGPDRYGLNPSFTTRQARGRGGDDRGTRTPPPERADHTPWQHGTVKAYRRGGYGFIQGDGEDFWFNAGYLFRADEDIRRGDRVWFLPMDALPNASSRRASEILVEGSRLEGVLHKVHPPDFGFADCISNSGSRRQMFVYLGDSDRDWKVGDRVSFRVSSNDRGVAGEDAEFIDE